MKEIPLLFSTPMVQSTMAGLKSQTRRLRGLDDINKNPNEWKIDSRRWFNLGEKDDLQFHYMVNNDKSCIKIKCPYGQPGDILWVRETWALPVDRSGNDIGYQFKADYTDNSNTWKWKPSIHMPKIACRLKLEVQSIKLERLQDITEDDCITEGIKKESCLAGNIEFFGYRRYDTVDMFTDDAIQSYHSLWSKLNGKLSWYQNPWVWVIEFKIIENLK